MLIAKPLRGPYKIVACGLAFAYAVTAQFPGAPKLLRADLQSWNELDISAKVTPTVDVTWNSQARLSTEVANPTVCATGIDIDVGLGQHLLLTPSYYYFTFRESTGRSGHGQLSILAMTILKAHGKWTISDRNRFAGQLATTNTADLWVYGNRPRVDRSVGPERWKTSLFLWDELFYFSGPVSHPRNRAALGVRKAVTPAFAFNLYYQRQDDSYSKPGNINTIGVLIEARVR
jgi:hypothetical protein